jgi:hypothetical protein
MKELKEYVAKEQQWASIFKGHVAITLTTAEGRKRIAERIDCALSPENLSCDGELPAAQVRARYRNLTRCAEQLIKLDPTVAQYMYEYA